MSELDKMHLELQGFMDNVNHDLSAFKERMETHMEAFRFAMARAREIERQAGIGEEK